MNENDELTLSPPLPSPHVNPRREGGARGSHEMEGGERDRPYEPEERGTRDDGESRSVGNGLSLSPPRLTFFSHFTLSIHAVGGSERSERFTFPSGRLRRVKREGVTRPPEGSVPLSLRSFGSLTAPRVHDERGTSEEGTKERGNRGKRKSCVKERPRTRRTFISLLSSVNDFLFPYRSLSAHYIHLTER